MKKIFFKLVVIFSFILFNNCGKSLKEVAKEVRINEKIPLVELKNVSILSTKGEFVNFNLKADVIRQYQDEDNIALENIKIKFFDSKGKIQSEVSALFGLTTSNYEYMSLYENVVIHSIQDNRKIFTEKLYYDKKQDLIYGDSKVKIQDQNMTIYGERFDSKGDLSKINLYKVKGSGNIPESLLEKFSK